jgi:hypothetical protein
MNRFIFINFNNLIFLFLKNKIIGYKKKYFKMEKNKNIIL